MADRRRSPKLAALILLISFGPMAGWLAYEGLQARRLATAAEPSTCSVLGAGVQSGGGGHVPWAILVHTIAGERFERRDEGPARDTEAEARAAIAELTPGRQVRCRYVTGAPSLVLYFEREAGRANLQLVGAGVLALLIVVAFGWSVFRTRRP